MKEGLAHLREKFASLEKHWRVLIASLVSLVGFFVIGSGAILAYGATQENKVLPGVHVGSFSVAGMSEKEVKDFLSQMTEKRLGEGVKITVDTAEGKKSFTLMPEIKDKKGFKVSHNIDADAKRIFTYGKSGNLFVDSWSAVVSGIMKPHLHIASIDINEDELYAELKKILEPYSQEPVDADIIITDDEPLTYTITTSSPGYVFEYDKVAKHAEDAWKTLNSVTLDISSKVAQPEVKESDLKNMEDHIRTVLKAGGHTIAYHDAHIKRDHTWTITKKQVTEWLAPVRLPDGQLALGLGASSTEKFISEKIVPIIETEPKDAVFELSADGTKATNIVAHRPGVTIDVEKTIDALNTAFATRLTSTSTNSKSELSVALVNPKVTLDSTNKLGIKEALGTGYSNFSGSPRNRILNIKNAVFNKLHGTIIKPGEEFSLVQNLKPFTLEAGYLPELVIVGDRIKPEIAGGLCQVGTTMFRTAMNSGMPITQRVNHGLVVSYYNDPANNNPGTDATIYDAWPDFRFLNDTGAHIAVTVSMNTQTGDLTFTFWGTSDGRKGSYTPPVVTKWIGAGPYKEIPTKDLPPGKKECQSVHPGAETYFTYTRQLANGTKEDRVFTSKYRAVPATCYVGVSAEQPVCEEGQTENCKPAGESEPSTENDDSTSEDEEPSTDTPPAPLE